jgi:hypothetical protein
VSIECEDNGGVGRFERGTYVLKKYSSSKESLEEEEEDRDREEAMGGVPKFMIFRGGR